MASISLDLHLRCDRKIHLGSECILGVFLSFFLCFFSVSGDYNIVLA